MKKSKRYVKKMEKRSLINKKALSYIISHSNICQYAIKELKLAGYGKGEGGPNDWMYQQVLEAVAVFTSHGNSGSSAPWEIDFVKRLCSWDIISPLTFKDDEWQRISGDGTCQNKRKSSIFKDPSICNIRNHETDKGYMPKPKRIIPCVEVEISPDNWIMAVSADSTELLLLSCDYNIKWEQVSCLKGIRLEDVTPELDSKAYAELKNNKH